MSIHSSPEQIAGKAVVKKALERETFSLWDKYGTDVKVDSFSMMGLEYGPSRRVG
jgi:hypothetical protein